MIGATLLDELRNREVLSDLDVHFGRLLARLGEEDPGVLLAGALTSRATGLGHVCLHLDDPPDELAGPEGAVPIPDRWGERLARSPVVGRPGESRPLVLDGAGRLYLYRYWNYEREVADFVWERSTRHDEPVDPARLREGLHRLFPRPPALSPGTADSQKVAAATALLRSLCVIAGGPGTGKTTTVVRVLALLQEQAGAGPLRVALAAPTGKAAARIQEAVRSARDGLPCAPAVKASIPEETATLHRLLGVVPGSPEPRHGRANPLSHDVVVVDEVSMVDLALMAKLIRALRPEARLLLLGDRDQLASVEAGAVLGDLCDTGVEHRPSPTFARRLAELTGEPVSAGAEDGPAGPRDALALLDRSYRFAVGGGIGAVSRAVNEGDAATAVALLRSDRSGTSAWQEVPPPALLAGALADRVRAAFGPYLAVPEPAEAFDRFVRFRILCGRRSGPYGAVAVNRRVEEILAGAGLVDPGREWYPGRPVLVTRNDHALRLYNGDIGLVLPDRAAGGSLRAFFPGPDGGVRSIAPLRLPAVETVYAMTVHKSQGSEFDAVLLLLGAQPSRVLTRELLYTGITRARRQVEVWGTEEVFRGAVATRSRRASGLRDALWGRGAGALLSTGFR